MVESRIDSRDLVVHCDGAWRRRSDTGGGVKPNRSIPSATVIPVLIYPDVRAAVEWLGAAFGSSSACGSARTTAPNWPSATGR